VSDFHLNYVQAEDRYKMV